MRPARVLLLLAAAALPLAGPAMAARSPVDMTVVDDPTLANGIAVYRQPGRGGPDYWCSAGDYAARKYGNTGYVLTLARPLGAPGGPSNRQSMGFTVSAGRDGGSSRYSLDQVGESHAVSATKNLCNTQRQRFERDSGR